MSDKRTDYSINSWPIQTFNQCFTYDRLGNTESVGYPTCSSCCVATPRTLSYGYTNGRLTAVTGYAGITYQANGAFAQIQHTNGVIDSISKDPHHYLRPAQVRTYGTSADWLSSTYAYDGAGNIKSIVPHTFRYDRYGRLTESMQTDGRTTGGTQHSRDFTYDGFGNLTAVTKQVGSASPTVQNLPANPATNHLTSAAYDDAGNLTAWSGATFVYDAFGMVQRTTNGTEDWAYAYTADDERFFGYRVIAASQRENYFWLRDLNGQLIREISENGDPVVFRLERDYIRRPGGNLVAAETPQGRRHFHPDHLGTPRLITDGNGTMMAYHAYSPYGEELTSPSQDGERLKFTSHERDLMDPAGTGDDLDYMHARYYKPLLGRFLSVDPATPPWPTKAPSKWNRYTYVLNNPLKFNDPTGERQNPVTGQRGIDPVPERGTKGRIRSNSNNPAIGQFGFTRNNRTKFHGAIDINARRGARLYAAETGIITDIGRRGAGGNRLQITTDQGTLLTYSHLDSFAPGLNQGSRVLEGEIVGTAGITGNARDMRAPEEHLHFSVVLAGGTRIDPVDWLNDPTAPDPLIMSVIEPLLPQATCLCSTNDSTSDLLFLLKED